MSQLAAFVAINAVTNATYTSEVFNVPRREPGPATVLVQANITMLANIAVQGRVHATAPWHTLANVTATGMVSVASTPEMRLVLTGNTGVSSAWVSR